MSTPVHHSSNSNNLPAPATPAYTPATSVPVVEPFGWILALAAGTGLLLATWMLYPIDYDGMWAGYRDGLIGTVVIIAALALRTSLAPRPSLALLGLSGILLVLFALFLDNPHKVFVTEIGAGVLLLVGTGLQAAAGRR
jgi:hypothetical protein